MRKLRRHNENIWRASGFEIHRQIHVDHENAVLSEIGKAKVQHYQDYSRSRSEGTIQSRGELKVDSTQLPDSDTTSSVC